MNEMNEYPNGQNDPQEVQEPVNINVDDNVAGDQHLTEPLEDESALDKLREQLDAQKDQYLRLAAEFDNFKRRTAKERVELIQTAGKDVISSLLDVLDDSERAEQQLEKTEDIGMIRDGVRLVFAKLRNTLASRGLKAMETKGAEFNPDLHEAITEIPASDELIGKVVDEVTKGYYLNEKIIRFAKVVVGK
jgi:molecular chaperone GrpE